MAENNISNTLRGLRTQFLYTLYRIVIDNNNDLTYFPEAIDGEDLDIYNDKILLETIQVKNYKDTVTFSSLKSPSHTTSLFLRGKDKILNYPDCKIKLVAFGSISGELTNTYKLCRKLEKESELKSFSKLLSNNFTYEIVDEGNLYSKISEGLKGKNILVDPYMLIKYSLQWIQEKAEKQEKITLYDLLEQITIFNEYKSKHYTALKELGSRVRFLFQDNSTIDFNLLKKSFYSGVSVKEGHIMSGLGIVRGEKEQLISKLFKETNVIIAHGISGQGKSALCYQYIKRNYVLAFEITDCNPQSVFDVINTIEIIKSGLSVPIILYIDDATGNKSEWYKIAQVFSNDNYVRIIVSMREEDWHQNRAQFSSSIVFRDFEVVLTDSEAQEVYNMLKSNNEIADVDFHESWSLFSDKGVLLEYMYYLTHGEKLRDRIVSQWEVLETKQQEILEYITIANYLGGQITEKALSAASKVNLLELRKIIKRLSGEFFEYRGNNVITDVHPIRTRLLKEIIFEDNLDLFFDESLKLYSKIEIGNPYVYLLQMLTEGLPLNRFFNYFSTRKLSPKQWSGVIRSLIWKGAVDFVEINKDSICKLEEILGSVWRWFLPVNFTEIDLEESFNVFFEKNARLKEKVKNIQACFTDQSVIFEHLKKFMSLVEIELEPNTDDGWLSISEIVYWASLSGVSDNLILPTKITVLNDDIEYLSSILMGIKTADINIDGVDVIEHRFVDALRDKFCIFKWRIDSEINGTLYLDYAENESESKKITTEKKLIYIAELCRRAFPDKNSYNFSYSQDFLAELYPTIASSLMQKTISRKYIPLREMHVLRNVIINVSERRFFKANSQKDYASSILDKRCEYVKTANIICRGINGFRKGSSSGLTAALQNIWNTRSISDIYKPSNSNVYGYGGIDERFAKILKLIDPDEEKSRVADAISAFHKTQNEFFTSISNFFTQFLDSIILKKYNCNPCLSNLFEAIRKLPILQKQYRQLFSQYFPNEDLYDIDNQENETYLSLWLICENHCLSPRLWGSSKLLKDKFSKNSSTLVDSLISEIKQSLTLEGIDCEIKVDQRDLIIETVYIDSNTHDYSLQTATEICCECFGNFKPFSSESLILQDKIENVIIMPVYVSQTGERLYLETSFDSYSISSLIGSVDFDMPLPCKVYKDCITTVPSLTEYRSVHSICLLAAIFFYQLMAIKENEFGIDAKGNSILLRGSNCYKSILLNSINNIGSLPNLKDYIRTEQGSTEENFVDTLSRALNFISKLNNINFNDSNSLLNVLEENIEICETLNECGTDLQIKLWEFHLDRLHPTVDNV